MPIPKDEINKPYPTNNIKKIEFNENTKIAKLDWGKHIAFVNMDTRETEFYRKPYLEGDIPNFKTILDNHKFIAINSVVNHSVYDIVVSHHVDKNFQYFRDNDSFYKCEVGKRKYCHVRIGSKDEDNWISLHNNELLYSGILEISKDEFERAYNQVIKKIKNFF